MFNIGFSELILLVLLALFFVRPKEFPALAKQLARILNQLRDSTSKFKDQIKTMEESVSVENLLDPSSKEKTPEAKNAESGSSEVNNSETQNSEAKNSEIKNSKGKENLWEPQEVSLNI